MFILSTFTYVLGYVIHAACTILPNISLDAFFSGVYGYWSANHNSIAAGIFEAIGSTGFALTKRVFVADMTSLDNSGVWSTLLDSHATIPTLYLGTIVAQRILDYSSWRCGWGMWAIVLPVAPLPFIGTMLYYQRRPPTTASVSEALGSSLAISGIRRVYPLLRIQLDLPGAVLLVAGLSLLLIPLSLTGSNNSSAWTHGLSISIPVFGGGLLDGISCLGHTIRTEAICALPHDLELHGGSCMHSRGIGLFPLFSVQRRIYKLPPGRWKLFCGLREKN
jgi:hypothetical protein